MLKNKFLSTVTLTAITMLMFACSDGGNGKGGNRDLSYSAITLIEVDFGRDMAQLAKIEFDKDLTANDMLPFYNDLDNYDFNIFDEYELPLSDISNSKLKNYFKNMKILGGVVIRDHYNDPLLRAYRNDTLFLLMHLLVNLPTADYRRRTV